MKKFNDIMKEIGQALVSKKFWVELLIMTFGMFMTGVCVYYFLVPSKLIVGSISGLSIVLTNIFNSMNINISLSMMISIINAILLILAYRSASGSILGKTLPRPTAIWSIWASTPARPIP